jgi:hypothetical protein
MAIRKKKIKTNLRKLSDLRSIGPAALKDFKLLGIDRVEDLKKKNSINLYNQLCEITNVRHDPCVIDVFRTAIEQAKDPRLESQKKNWWYWSKHREQSKK